MSGAAAIGVDARNDANPDLAAAEQLAPCKQKLLVSLDLECRNFPRSTGDEWKFSTG